MFVGNISLIFLQKKKKKTCEEVIFLLSVCFSVTEILASFVNANFLLIPLTFAQGCQHFSSGLTHIITMDLHQKEIQGFFNVPVDNLRASPFLIQYIVESVSAVCLKIANLNFYAIGTKAKFMPVIKFNNFKTCLT